MILVMSLWILAILAAFASLIGIGMRQKITLLSRLERREAIHFLAKAGVQKSRRILSNIYAKNHSSDFDAKTRMFLMNNPDFFQAMALNDGLVEVGYTNYDGGSPVVMYGIEDEERKLNINTAAVEDMERLFHLAGGLSEEDAQDLANAVLDWREVLDQELVGFYGDEYYSSLNYPYEPKKGNFEILDEVLMVKGMNPDVFNRVKDFITVYGEGKVNLNTAPRPVLLALGLSDDVADFIIRGRNGEDGLSATEDDIIFNDGGMSMQLGGIKLSPEQLAEIDQLYGGGKISSVSRFFHIRSKAVLLPSKEIRFVDCVVQANDGRMVAWREQ